MPRRVKGPDGVVRVFPDDATDAEIASALDSGSQPPAEEKSNWGSIKKGASEGWEDLKAVGKAVVGSPVQTAKALGQSLLDDTGLSGIPDIISNLKTPEGRTGTLAGAKDGFRVHQDVLRNVGRSETRPATVRGFTDGALAQSGESAESVEKDPMRAGTRVLVNTILPGAMLKAPAGTRLVKRVVGNRKPPLKLETAQETLARRVKAEPPKAPPAGGPTASRQPYRAPDPDEISPTPAIVESPLDALARKMETSGPTPPPTGGPTTSRIPFRAPDPVGPPSPNAGGRVAPKQPQAAAATPTNVVVDALKSISETAPQELRWSHRWSKDGKAAGAGGGIMGKGRKSPKKVEGKQVAEATESPVAPSAQREVGVGREGDGGSAPAVGAPNVTVRPKAGTVADLRGAVGSQRAASTLGISPADVKRLAPGPSRRPLLAEVADLDQGFMRQVANERGGVDPKLAVKMGVPIAGAAAGGAYFDENPLGGALVGGLAGLGAANSAATARTAQQIRMALMLFGTAPVKSVLGNVGAALNAVPDHGTVKPLRQLLGPSNIGTNAREFADGWRRNANPAGISGLEGKAAKLNVAGRFMGAADQMTQKALERGGLSEAQAKRQTLTASNVLGSEEALKTPLGQYLVPFQRVPFNQVFEGFKAGNELFPNSGATWAQRAASGGAVGAGALAGSEVLADGSVSKRDIFTLGLLSALAARRGLLVTGGAATQIGSHAAERLGTGLPDVGWDAIVDPTKLIDKPPLFRLLDYLKGGPK